MKFLVAGIGSMGSTIAAHLTEANENLMGYDTDEEKVAAITAEGLTVERPNAPDLSVEFR